MARTDNIFHVDHVDRVAMRCRSGGNDAAVPYAPGLAGAHPALADAVVTRGLNLPEPFAASRELAVQLVGEGGKHGSALHPRGDNGDESLKRFERHGDPLLH